MCGRLRCTANSAKGLYYRLQIFQPGSSISSKKDELRPSKNGAQTSFQFGTGYLPNAENGVPFATQYQTCRHLLGTEIRDEAPPLDLHFGRTPTPVSFARYRAIPEEGMNRFDLQKIAPDLTPGCWIRKVSGGTDLFGRLWWDRPAFTIRTEFFKPEKGRYLHPEQHRPITHLRTDSSLPVSGQCQFVERDAKIAKEAEFG